MRVKDSEDQGADGCSRCEMFWNLYDKDGIPLRVAIPYGLHDKFCPLRYPKHPERAREFQRTPKT